MESNGDKDAFAVFLKAGKSYRIDLWGDEPTAYGGTLTDAYLRLMSPTYTRHLNDAIVDLTNSRFKPRSESLMTMVEPEITRVSRSTST